MQITNDKVATFDFIVTDEQGEVIDSSSHNGPLSYIHGTGYLIPGMEAALEGKSVGDKFKVVIPPSAGYGERDESLSLIVPKDRFQGIAALEVGIQLEVGNWDDKRIMTVAEITDDAVILDGNHPLAGLTLNFEVSVLEVRDATEEELTYRRAATCSCEDDCDCHAHPGGGGGCSCC